ncbi:MAG: PIN domain-containing protein [Acidimicrobiia bacterium]|nr:PIN domain-containing protein [Acidimicrobiia bacterium]
MLVDTDVLSWVAFGRPEAKLFQPLLLDRLLFISFVTVGELYFGAEKANWGKTRVTRMEKTLKRYTVIPGTFETAKQYGRVKRAFRDQVDENDMWIAATSLTHKLAIITNNLKHFEPMSKHFSFSLVHPDRT